MVAPLQIALQLIEWTDPQKSVYVLSLFSLLSFSSSLKGHVLERHN